MAVFIPQCSGLSCLMSVKYILLPKGLGLQFLLSSVHICVWFRAGSISLMMGAQSCAPIQSSHPLGTGDWRTGAKLLQLWETACAGWHTGCCQLCVISAHQGQLFCSPFPPALGFTVLLSNCHPLGTSLREGRELA